MGGLAAGPLQGQGEASREGLQGKISSYTIQTLPQLPGLPLYRPPVVVLANPTEQRPAVGEAVDVEKVVSVAITGSLPPQRPLTHLREQTVWTGLRNRERQSPVWKSHRRSMLGVCVWAEARRELLPSSARAETWGGGRLREVVKSTGMSHTWAGWCPPCPCGRGRSAARRSQRAGPR